MSQNSFYRRISVAVLILALLSQATAFPSLFVSKHQPKQRTDHDARLDANGRATTTSDPALRHPRPIEQAALSHNGRRSIDDDGDTADAGQRHPPQERAIHMEGMGVPSAKILPRGPASDDDDGDDVSNSDGARRRSSQGSSSNESDQDNAKHGSDEEQTDRDSERHQALDKWRHEHEHDADKASTTTQSSKVDALQAVEEQGSPEQETSTSMHLFFVLTVMALCILAIYALHRNKLQYIPESIAIIIFGGLVGVTGQFFHTGWESAEVFDPTSFFLFLLPPIIFESGYSLHRGNFFRNLTAILIFAVFGTVVSALVIGGGLLLLGKYNIIYPLSSMESFAFGSLISAVDPVATLAIFQALDVDRTLYMLVFGESVLNDAVSIVLTRTILQLGAKHITIPLAASVLKEFLLASVGSAVIGVVLGLAGALMLKHLDMRTMPALEFGTLCIFAYLPYVLAEGLDLSGIMAILFGGLTHAHYTHYNLSPKTQVTALQTFRTVAFLAETLVFLYIGMATFTFELRLDVGLIFATIILCLLGRAANIFPLAAWINHQKTAPTLITRAMQFVMWFSGLRGAIAFALALHLPTEQFGIETKRILLSTTLVVVMVTIICFGGGTMPVLQWLKPGTKKTSMGRATEKVTDTDKSGDEAEPSPRRRPHESAGSTMLVHLDNKYFAPMFRRRLTKQEVRQARQELEQLATNWSAAVGDDGRLLSDSLTPQAPSSPASQ